MDLYIWVEMIFVIQEYLFKDKSISDSLKEYGGNKVKLNTIDIENTQCFIACFHVSGENEENAMVLSKLDDDIKKFSPIVLSNESSAYFNRRLFPLINEFERKLRKLLYLKSAMYEGNLPTDNIKNLESYDFGKIFDILFIDPSFNKATKDVLNNKNWKFTKAEIMDSINKLAENRPWDYLVGQGVPSFRNNYSDVKQYRNDVMHAHNINYVTYKKANKLFNEINKDIDCEIEKIISFVEYDFNREENKDFNKKLKSVIDISGATSLIQVLSERTKEIPQVDPTLLELYNSLQDNYFENIPKILSQNNIDGIEKGLSVLGRINEQD